MAEKYPSDRASTQLTPSPKGHELVPQQSLVRVQLSRLSAVADAIPAPVRKVSRHGAKICLHGGAVIAAVLTVAILGLYIRLAQGPISFSFVVPKLQSELNRQGQGYEFRIGDAILRLSQSWGLEFRLADVRVVARDGQEIAKAPYAAIDLSETALLALSVAPSGIDLLEPKLLVFSSPMHGLTLSPTDTRALSTPKMAANAPSLGNAAPQSEAQLQGQFERYAAQAPRQQPFFNPAGIFQQLFAILDKREGASSALEHIGIHDATIYFAGESGVTTWRVGDFTIKLNESSTLSTLTGDITLNQEGVPWHASFKITNRPREKIYAATVTMDDVVPRTIWKSFPSVEVLKLINLPVTGVGSFEISHDGELLNADMAIKLQGGQFFAPWDEKHPAVVDSGLINVSYDGKSNSLKVLPFEMRWGQSVLSLTGNVALRDNPQTGKSEWAAEIDGRNSSLASEQFGVPATQFDVFRLAASYSAVSDSVTLSEVRLRSGRSEILLGGAAQHVSSGAAISLNGRLSPMPLSLLKVLWPAFVANGAREWIGTNIPTGMVTGGSLAVNLTQAQIDSLDKDGDIPDSAVSIRFGLSGLQVYHIKGLPPINTRETSARIDGRRFVFDIPNDARIEVPSGKVVSFSDAQFVIDDLRPHFPNAEIHFKGAGEASGVLELLDQPPLNYVKAVGFKTNFINGQVATTFKITFPLLNELKFKQLGLSGKTRVSDLRSNGLPGGLALTGGAVTFDVSETAISAGGDVRVNGIPVNLTWQRIYDAPPEKQPPLRASATLTEKGRDDLALNINHIVRGDVPVLLSLAMQRDAPPKLSVEANLTNADLFLTAVGWRKPPGQKASLSFEVNQRPDNWLVADNFALTGDGLNIGGRILFNEKRRIAGFNLPEFSTNALTKLAITGELTPQNVLKVQAKGPSYDGRQFFKALFSSGKLAENQPAPLKDEPGLDLSVEIDTVFGYNDSTLKSLVVEAKRRGGKISNLDLAARLNGEAPMAVHIDQKPGQPRFLICDATDAGSAFRLVGLYSAMRGGQMNLQVNLDGTKQLEKAGTLLVNRFAIVGDQAVGRVISRAEEERARTGRAGGKAISSNEPLQFDRLGARFDVAGGQLNLQESVISGPLLGATMRGHADLVHDRVSFVGTYVPLYGLNSVFGALPLVGDLLKGREGEGVLGITFAIQGSTNDPDVKVNPVSMMAPGFLRQIFEFENTPGEQQQQNTPKPQAQPQKTPQRSSSSQRQLNTN